MNNIIALLTSRKKTTVSLAAPDNIILAANNQSIALNWSLVANATSYGVYVGLTATELELRSVTTATNFNITGLVNDTLYYIALDARYLQQQSVLSATVTGTPTGVVAGSFFNNLPAENMITSLSDVTFPVNNDEPVLFFSKADITAMQGNKAGNMTIYNRIAARSDYVSKAAIYRIDNNLAKGKEAIEDAFIDMHRYMYHNDNGGPHYKSYEDVKDAGRAYQMSLLVFDLCKQVFATYPSFSVTYSYTDLSGTFSDTATCSKSAFSTLMFDLLTKVPGMANSSGTLILDAVASHIGGHQATGFLAAFSTVCVMRENTIQLNKYFGAFFGASNGPAGQGKLAQDYFIRSGLNSQGSYAGTKGLHWMIHEMTLGKLSGSKTVYPPQLKWYAYFWAYMMRNNQHPFIMGEFNNNWYGLLYNERFVLVLAAFLYQDDLFLTLANTLGFPSDYGGNVQQAVYLPTVEDMMKLRYPTVLTGTADLSVLPNVRVFDAPLSGLVVRNGFMQADGTALYMNTNEKTAGLHASFSQSGDIQIGGYDGWLLTGPQGMYDKVWSTSEVNYTKGDTHNNPGIRDQTENWTVDSNGVKTWLANTGRARRTMNSAREVDYYHQLFDEVNYGVTRANKISIHVDQEKAWNEVYTHVDLTSGFVADKSVFANKYNTRSLGNERQMICVRPAAGQTLTLVVDRINPVSTAMDVWVPWHFQSAMTMNGSRSLTATSNNPDANTRSKIALYSLLPQQIQPMTTSRKTDWKVNGIDSFFPNTFSRFKEKCRVEYYVDPVDGKTKTKQYADRVEIRPLSVLPENIFASFLLTLKNGDTVPVESEMITNTYGNSVVSQYREFVFVYTKAIGLSDSFEFKITPVTGVSSHKIYVLGIQAGVYSHGTVIDTENILKFNGTAKTYLVEKTTAPTLSDRGFIYKAFRPSGFTTDIWLQEFLPRGYVQGTNFPCIINLHGDGDSSRGPSDGSEKEQIATNGLARLIKQGAWMEFVSGGKLERLVVISPQLYPDKTLDNWIKNDHLLKVVQYVLATYKIDPNRLYLMGLSLGGYAVWNHAANATKNSPNKFAAIASAAGWGTQSQKADLTYNSISTAHLATNKVDVFASHHRGDPTVPFGAEEATVNDLIARASRGEVIWQPINDSRTDKHNVWDDMFRLDNSLNTPNLYEWFLSHKRGV